MTHVFPPAARYVFCYFEPLSLIAGAVAPFIDASFFVSSQLASQPPHPLLPSEHVLALQIGNLYMLMCLVGLAVLNTTTEARVCRAYIWALWIADVGHVGVTAWSMGSTDLFNVAAWNSMAWGNIGATTFLFFWRSLYLLGLLGSDKTTTISIKQD